jgi:phosphoribosyl-dephospho-CoA transferase
MESQDLEMAKNLTLTCLLCAQTASLCAYSFLAYLQDMSRHLLRGALHFEPLARAIEHHVGAER